jgi:hypothetical protein
MTELIRIGTYLAFTVFISFIVYNSIKYFGISYKKCEFLENRILRFLITLFISLVYGFVALFGGSPMENDE